MQLQRSEDLEGISNFSERLWLSFYFLLALLEGIMCFAQFY